MIHSKCCVLESMDFYRMYGVIFSRELESQGHLTQLSAFSFYFYSIILFSTSSLLLTFSSSTFIIFSFANYFSSRIFLILSNLTYHEVLSTLHLLFQIPFLFHLRLHLLLSWIWYPDLCLLYYFCHLIFLFGNIFYSYFLIRLHFLLNVVNLLSSHSLMIPF